MVQRAAALADVPAVLGAGVLRVVQQQIERLGELEAGGPRQSAEPGSINRARLSNSGRLVPRRRTPCGNGKCLT